MDDRITGSPSRKLFLLPILFGLIVGVGVYFWQQSVAEAQRREAAKERAQLMDDLQRLQTSASSQTECMERVRLLEREVNALRQFRAEHSGDAATEYIPVYGPDARFDPEHMEKAFYVAVPAGLPILQKLRLLASKVSWYRFDRLPIEVLRVEDVNGKQIAIVDLREPEGIYTRYSWSRRYFQGSTGGQITQRTLVLTFLQKDYPDEWIDGVRFYYQGKPFEDEWDHIRMIGTFYRDGTRDLTRPS